MSEKLVQHILDSSLVQCIGLYNRNIPLIDNIQNIFAQLGENLCLVFNRAAYIHLFTNQNLPEMHVLSQPEEPVAAEKNYQRISFEARNETFQAARKILHQENQRWVDVPLVSELTPQELGKLTHILQCEFHDELFENPILVPFNFGDANLGTFCLWGDGGANYTASIIENGLLNRIAAIYFGLRDFLNKECGRLLPETYLPSLFSARWFRVAVLKADIHNFAPLSEMLRNIYGRRAAPQTKEVSKILNEHCQEMARVIQQEGQGRIDRFIGPGLTAIFGEHDDHPIKAAAGAVYAALKMVENFRPLREKFLLQAFGEHYDVEFNEATDIYLGIGVDYGTVLFDYLGDDDHREYTILGDHVNFANLLCHEAGRYDPQERKNRPPVLISPTVERCIRPWLSWRTNGNTKTPRLIMMRDVPRGMSYTAFGLFPEDFNAAQYLRCRSGLETWDSAWSKLGQPAPR